MRKAFNPTPSQFEVIKRYAPVFGIGIENMLLEEGLMGRNLELVDGYVVSNLYASGNSGFEWIRFEEFMIEMLNVAQVRQNTLRYEPRP